MELHGLLSNMLITLTMFCLLKKPKHTWHQGYIGAIFKNLPWLIYKEDKWHADNSKDFMYSFDKRLTSNLGTLFLILKESASSPTFQVDVPFFTNLVVISGKVILINTISCYFSCLRDGMGHVSKASELIKIQSIKTF